MAYSITVDIIKGDGSMGEMILTRDGKVGGQTLIYFDDMNCKCVAIDLTDAVKFLTGGERGKLSAPDLPKWERLKNATN